MKIHRFFVKEKIIDSSEISISDTELVHQIKNVLRLKVGETVSILDNTGAEFLCKVKDILKKELIFSKESMKNFSRHSKGKIKLFPAMIKKDKLEFVLQKCTEIGVLEFCPILSNRTEKQNFNLERAETIIREAAEQSEKNFLPSVDVPVRLVELIGDYETGKKFLDVKNSFYLDIEAPLIDVSSIVKHDGEVSIFVGPEGGWSEKDKMLFASVGIKPCSLGQTVLRAETASIAIASLLLLGR
jgi:16S rRNA (uracil1498-N3)-methyltransferase